MADVRKEINFCKKVGTSRQYPACIALIRP